MPAFDNTGSVALQGGDLTGVRAFSNAGLLTASDGVARTLGADAFTNQSTGVLSQANGRLSDVLTITGNYIGAAGSRVQQDIDLALPGNAGAGDRIVVGGSASGATTFVFNPTSSRRAVFTAPIPVFTTSGDNTLAANEGKLGQLARASSTISFAAAQPVAASKSLPSTIPARQPAWPAASPA